MATSTGRITKVQTANMARQAARDAIVGDKLRADIEENFLIAWVVATQVKAKGWQAEYDKICQIDRRWLHTSNTIRVQMGALFIALERRYGEGITDRVLLPDCIARSTVMIDPGPAIRQRFNNLQTMRDAVESKKKAVEVQIAALVERAGTVRALAELWPEGREYWQPLWDKWKAGRSLPTVDVEAINKLIGLPKDGEGTKAHG